MGLPQEVRSLFSPVTRQRGEEYLQSGAVELLTAEEDHVHLVVDGSRGAEYDVTLDRFDAEEYRFDCSCPHYQGGSYCKHLWAAVRMVDERQLLADRPARHVELTPAASKSNPAPRAGWRTQLERPQQPLPSLPIEPSRARRVHYLLEATAHGELPSLSLYQQTQRKDGEWGKAKPLGISHHTRTLLSDPHDRRAIGLLLGNRVKRVDYEYDHYESPTLTAGKPTQVDLVPELFATVLPALAATGRFVWMLSSEQDWEDAVPVTWDDGPAWDFRLNVDRRPRQRHWQIAGELVRPGKTARSPAVRPVTDAVRCYAAGLILMDDRLAAFTPPADPRWLETCCANETLEVPFKERAVLLSELWRSGEALPTVGDAELSPPHTVGKPVGRLLVHPPRDLPYHQRDPSLYASVAYRYGEREVAPLTTQDEAWLSDDGTRMVTRDKAAETVLLDRLAELKVTPKEVSRWGDTPPGHVQFSPRNLHSIVATLVEEGWIVDAEGTRIRKGGSVSVSIHSGIDWFDVEGQIDFDGVPASLPDLLTAIRTGESYIELGDGSRGLLPQKWLDQYALLAEFAADRPEAAKGEDAPLRFQPAQALLLDSLLSSRDSETALSVDRKFAALRKRLQSFSGVKPANAPRSFHGELRDYQNEGLGWLRFLERFGFGGCLADDMGLGKTVQVLALLADRRRRQLKGAPKRPSLVVAPKSLVHNWHLESQRFAPRLNVVNYTGINRKKRVEDFATHDVVLTTYGTLRKDIERFSETAWDYAILDEAQAIKNAQSQSAKACRVLNARHRLALSGTPIENHLGELWSLFEFLNPGLLGKSRSLKKLVQKSGEADDDRLEALRNGVAPFLLRRTKKQVLPQLPKKSEQRLDCDLLPAQRKQYNQLRDHYRAALTQRIAKSGLAKSKLHVLEALLRLRQAACHPGLIDAKQKGKPSAKLDTLLEHLNEATLEGHKALVFSQFTTMLDIVRSRLDAAGTTYEYLDGKTSDRQKRVERFQSDADCPIFLISLKAGGTGLNLTAADYVFLLDPWWNPAVEAQAIDRAHRIGQANPVFAYRLIARGTVEEKILELQSRKSDLAEAIISSNSSLLRSLTADDLQALLS